MADEPEGSTFQPVVVEPKGVHDYPHTVVTTTQKWHRIDVPEDDRWVEKHPYLKRRMRVWMIEVKVIQREKGPYLAEVTLSGRRLNRTGRESLPMRMRLFNRSMGGRAWEIINALNLLPKGTVVG